MSSLFYHATKFLVLKLTSNSSPVAKNYPICQKQETNLYLCSDWSMFQHDAGPQIQLLDNPQVCQLADATGDFVCLVFIFLATY